MAKVKFLKCAILPSLNKVYNFGEEVEITDENAIKKLQESGVVQIIKSKGSQKATETKSKKGENKNEVKTNE